MEEYEGFPVIATERPLEAMSVAEARAAVERGRGPSFAEDVVAADRAHAEGRTRSAADVFAELDAQGVV